MITKKEAIENALSVNKYIPHIMAEIERRSKEGKTRTDYVNCDENCKSILEYLGFNVEPYELSYVSKIRVSW